MLLLGLFALVQYAMGVVLDRLHAMDTASSRRAHAGLWGDLFIVSVVGCVALSYFLVDGKSQSFEDWLGAVLFIAANRQFAIKLQASHSRRKNWQAQMTVLLAKYGAAVIVAVWMLSKVAPLPNESPPAPRHGPAESIRNPVANTGEALRLTARCVGDCQVSSASLVHPRRPAITFPMVVKTFAQHGDKVVVELVFRKPREAEQDLVRLFRSLYPDQLCTGDVSVDDLVLRLKASKKLHLDPAVKRVDVRMLAHSC